jgi:hypothetical protein
MIVIVHAKVITSYHNILIPNLWFLLLNAVYLNCEAVIAIILSRWNDPQSIYQTRSEHANSCTNNAASKLRW